MPTSTVKKIITLGASLTSSPWYTWKDFVEIETGITCQDLSARGVGNEYLIHSLIKHRDSLDKDTLILCMLTSFDKFDWYVAGERYNKLHSEKHQPQKISDTTGFWCTGSWFPLEKELYKQNFYDEDYFCTKTIQQILLLQRISEITGCHVILFFDSPIWTLTEQAINQILPENQHYSINKLKTNFLGQPLSSFWKSMLDPSLIEIEDISLLGFCWKNNLLWYNPSVKCHPPSSSQWEFYKSVVKPAINQYIETRSIDLTQQIRTFDQKWKEY